MYCNTLPNDVNEFYKKIRMCGKVTMTREEGDTTSLDTLSHVPYENLRFYFIMNDRIILKNVSNILKGVQIFSSSIPLIGQYLKIVKLLNGQKRK